MPTDRAFLDALRVHEIGADVNCAPFVCESEGVTWFLKNVALAHHVKRVSTTMCWMAGQMLAGYISTRTDQIKIVSGEVREGMGLTGIKVTASGQDRKVFPSLLIAMLGVANDHCGKGLGYEMVQYAIGRAREISRTVGCRFVRVDSEKTEKALRLYRKARFRSSPEQEESRGTEAMYFDLGPREPSAAPSAPAA
jgi:GNAT superfamily N-acetyltransferase